MGPRDSFVGHVDASGPPWRPEVGDRVFVISVQRWGTVIATFFEQGTWTHVKIDGAAGEASWVALSDLAPEPASYREA